MSKNVKPVNPMKVITGPETRWSYANVWEAKSINGGAPKFSVSLIIPKSDTRTVEKIKAAIEAAYKEGESKLKSASEHAEELQKLFPGLTVACVHGRMKPKEKEAVMAAFAAGETDILVSTTVVEVGVDVPNATLMVVENAERFGLSQLHQLRGRVGRGKAKSYCVLVSDTPTEESRERLRVLTRTNNGFEIAQADLELRGPGDFFGSRQHGLPEMHVKDLLGSMDMLHEAQSAAEALCRKDPALAGEELAPLRNRIAELFTANEGTWN